MQLVLIDGVPGTGKSTLAKNLCAIAAKSGIDARWYLEESHDHPVHPKPNSAWQSSDGFAQACLRAWAAFVDEWKDRETLHILEGSAFQSTVRLMMERGLIGIEPYYNQFEEIVRVLAPKMVYLRPSNVREHSAYISALRGGLWSEKVASYLATTPYCVDHHLQGLQGMHRFWDAYAQRCDALVSNSSIETQTIEFATGGWDSHLDKASCFVAIN